ncbi:hypothetical protein VTN31DRAFT_3120 [Thermomyces dupontii]|uniref:uncharacterized protein n=1 Tax=Talaromyces thermophilus TaxID=28565 RepID=UPI00374468E1
MAESEEVAQQAAGQEPDVKDKEQGREKHDEKSPDEASERPVRRKLQETRITSDSFKEGAIGNDLSHSSDDSGSERGRLRKKRSIDELNSDNAPSTHRRKRSRGSEDDDGGGGDGDVKAPRETTPERSAQADRGTQNLLSPKKKRSLDQLEKESPGNGDVKSAAGGGDRLHAVGERETKRYRDASQERRREDNAGINAKSTLSSSFLNTSSVSPFASLAGSASTGKESSTQPAQTSSSAFAASSIASFAGSEQSPFGALGSSSTSVFKSASSATTSTAEKPATSGFAAAGSGASPFAPGPSGFATLGASGGSALGKGFGSGTTGKPLTSFASQSGGASTFGGSKETKPFGAAEEESDKEEASDQEQGGAFEEEQKKDERFYEQQIETGEEGEKTYFSCKAKLFHFTNGEWKERGLGTFKVNVREPEDEATGQAPEKEEKDEKEEEKKEKEETKKKITARMIMRADGVLRVMLNSPIFKGMPVGDVSGAEPKGKQLNLASVEEGRTVPLLLRVGNPELAKELYGVIKGIQERL